MTVWDKTLRIVVSVLFVAAVALLGSAFTDTSTDWYQGLTLPALQPPPVVFSVVWSAIYLLFAASLSIVSLQKEIQKNTLLLYAISGVLNVLWSHTFFVRENPAGALFVLIAIIITAALLIPDTFTLNKVAAYLLLPYLLWLCFALYLNYEVAFLN
jgi:tryptophan-rich sensory protein